MNHVLRPFSGWGLPGGFVDHGESPEQAIRRELMEETGIELDQLKMFRVRVVGTHIEILFTATGLGLARVRSPEIIEVDWFGAENLPEGLSRSQRSLILEVLKGES